MCYRHFDHQSTDTNMLVESFHNKLKMNPRYLAHQVNKRIDDLVGTLLQIEDLFFDRMRKEVMRDSSEASLKQEGTDRHTRGMEIPDESIQMVSEDIFKVVSTSGEKEYTIHVYAEQCALGSKCVPHCIAPECSHLCRCIMECSCIDYKCGHICKHTHKVRALVVNTQVEDLKPINHQSIIEDEPTETTETSTVYMCTPSQDKRKSSDINGRKEAVRKMLEAISESCDQTCDSNVLERVLCLLTQASAALKAVTQSLPENELCNFEVKEKFAPAQKNEIQLRLWKTSKDPGRKPSNPPMKKPSNDDKLKIMSVISGSQQTASNSNQLYVDRETNICIVKDQQPQVIGKKRKRCGTCKGCTRVNCEKCVNCQDMPKYGGPGKKKRPCSERKCERLTQETDTLNTARKENIQPVDDTISRKLTDNFISGSNNGKNKQPKTQHGVAEELMLSCDAYLTRQSRKVIKIKRDGNCFYASLSFQLFGTQDEDFEVRHVVTSMVKKNQSIFRPYFIPRKDVDTIEKHCEQNWPSGAWATQVEVVAAATVFAVPIFFIEQSGNEHKWNTTIYPLHNPTLKYPHIPEMEECALLRPTHFELLYYTNSHYDAIVSVDTGRVCIYQPLLSGESSELIEISD
ncbi:uncharacterized protein [Dysidea avara]